jgi:enoyl-CoA hydratase
MTPDDSVLHWVEGRIGHLTLNRPAALNALDLGMIRSMRAALDHWRDAPDISLVVLDGAGDRAFCAGGDITVVHRAAREDPEAAWILWAEEYRLDALIAHYPKPVVAFMDGITMGGGVGIASHASVRVVTERTVLAMPEVAIGLAPDVGSALLLSRAPREIGLHLALAATRVNAADAIYCGLADHAVPSLKLAGVRSALGTTSKVASAEEIHSLIAAEHAEAPADGVLQRQRPWIDACYGPDADTVEEIIERLGTRTEPAAAQAAGALGTAAPTALKVTLRSVRSARTMPGLEECLRQDYRLCRRFLEHPDLVEGIRAAVIDKDRSPRWNPSSLLDVSAADVDRFFASLGVDELALP